MKIALEYHVRPFLTLRQPPARAQVNVRLQSDADHGSPELCALSFSYGVQRRTPLG